MTIFGMHFELFPLILTIIFAVSFVYLAVYYGLFHLRVAQHKGVKSKTQHINNATPSVSIVLVAKNEEKFLTNNLTYLLEQDYPNYEVVVVDYTSSDNTQYVLQVYKENYPDKLRVVRFGDDVNLFKGKKFPLAIGIQSAQNDIILLTDADCVPKSFSWVSRMVAPFDNPAIQIVLGYCGFERKQNLLNDFIQYENLSGSGAMFGSALLRNAYFGNGRNLAYRRDFFFQKEGFMHHYNIAVGDDSIFVNQNSTPSNTAVCLSHSAFMTTPACKNVSAWITQRRKRRGAIPYYRTKNKSTMLIHTLLLILFYLTGILAYTLNPVPMFGFVLLGILFLKIVWQVVCMFRMCVKFHVQRRIAFFSTFFELYFLFANTFLYLFSLRNKNKR